MNKHTPGPWREQVVDRETRIIGAKPLTQDVEVALMICHGYLACGMPTAEDAANARLIAAAPDLLAALKQLVADWESVDERVQVPDEINVNEHWDAARVAIAKAETS